MLVHLLKSKIHRATVTDAHVDYEGSLTISTDLMEAAGLFAYEKILCGNLNNGNRFETYVIPGQRGAGQIVMNGGVAHLGRKGHKLTIMSFTEVEHAKAKRWKPTTIVLGPRNHPVAPKSRR